MMTSMDVTREAGKKEKHSAGANDNLPTCKVHSVGGVPTSLNTDTTLSSFGWNEVIQGNAFQHVASALWKMYRKLVREHRIQIELADDAVNQLLFWLPHHDNSGDGAPWREVLYGLLSVQRLAMHCSLQSGKEGEGRMGNSYGTTLCTSLPHGPTVPATSIRIALSIIHCLMPSILEVVSYAWSSSPSVTVVRDPASVSIKRRTKMRLRLEQVKFVFRLYLLFSYWNESLRRNREKERDGAKQTAKERHCNSSWEPGLLMNGGLYQAGQREGMDPSDLLKIQRRRDYSGRRTGLRISKISRTSLSSRLLSSVDELTQPAVRVILGELLYCLRPVYWAAVEASNSEVSDSRALSTTSIATRASLSKLQSWLTALMMDITSLSLLVSQRRNGNPLSKEEWKRRRMRLFLYILRSPIWSHFTSPVLTRTSSAIQKIPLLGSLIDAFLWDWILYWKHPYVAEEG